KKNRSDAALLQRIKEHLERDRNSRKPDDPADRRLALSEHARSLLTRIRRRMEEMMSEARKAVDEYTSLEMEREDVERALGATPKEEAEIQAVIERFKAAMHSKAVLEDQAKRLERDIE